ncbi:hypothetical protein [Agromyces sp. ZXT2-3]|uniref:hypothetical protein n=1 Tax=Agromyces sp. ZXT2-3 TaxID=3461152 RepID=UPI004054C38F
MSDGNRIAELQRLAYGAGTDDAVRVAAADELHRLRRRAARPGSDGPGVEAANAPTVTMTAADADPFDALGVADDRPVEEPRGAPSAAVRAGVLVGAIALALGFGAGWVSGAQAASDLAGGDVPDESLTFELAPSGSSETGDAVPLDEARAMAVFERTQVPEDVPDFGDPSSDPATYRRVGSYPGGASIHVARSADSAQVCLMLDVREVGGMSTCTTDGEFPSGGLFAEGGFESAFYRIGWAESGEVSYSSRPTN